MFDREVLEKLKQRYTGIHPLIFKRSVEKAKTVGELFDILEDIPKTLPIKWCEEKRKWIYYKGYFEIDPFLEKCGLKNGKN